MSQDLPLPPDYRFLASNFKLTDTQAKELAALSERWAELDKRWGYRFLPGEPLLDDFKHYWFPLERDLREYGYRHGFIIDPPKPPYTLGMLIQKLRSFEETSKWADEDFKRQVATDGPTAASGWRMRQAAYGAFCSPSEVQLEIDRITLFCDELGNGNGLTSANVAKLRAQICRKRACTLGQANSLSLAEAADILENAAPKGGDSAGDSSTPNGNGKRKRANGRVRLELKEPLKFHVYQRIRAIHQPNTRYHHTTAVNILSERKPLRNKAFSSLGDR